jgi:hypothetical protein
MTATFMMDDAPPVIVDPAASLDALSRHLLAFRLYGRTTVAMVARLDGYLDRLEAIPLAEWCRWQAGAGRRLALSSGPLGSPPPPHLWPWRLPLAGWTTRGYPLACRCRDAYLRLDRGGRCAAQARWGPLMGPEGGQDFRPLWRLGCSVDRLAALDGRAERLRVRTLDGLGRA